jgi:antitoxin ParD1/3/4
MDIDLKPEDQQKAEALVASGRFTSVADALHAGLEAIHEDDEWQDYARDRIAAGIADLEAGRTISGDDFLAWLQTQQQKQA